MADNTTLNAMTGGDSIATDEVVIGGVTTKAQRVKVGYGADGSYTDVSPAAPMPTVVAATTWTGSATAINTDLITSKDVSAYASLSIRLSGTFSGVYVEVQGCHDPAANNWFTLSTTYNATSNRWAPYITGNLALTQPSFIYGCPVVTPFVRVRCTAYSSGTVTAHLTAHPATSGPPVMAVHNAQGDALNVSPLSTGAPISSAITDSASTSVPASGPMVWAQTIGRYYRARGDVNGGQTTRTYETFTGTTLSSNSDWLFTAGGVGRDVSMWSFFAIHFPSGNGQFVVQGSNDNTTWITLTVSELAETANGRNLGYTQSPTALSGDVWGGPLFMRYLRVRGGNTINSSLATPIVNFTTDTVPPATPSRLFATDGNNYYRVRSNTNGNLLVGAVGSTTVSSGRTTIATANTAVVLGSGTASSVTLKALSTNTTAIYVGTNSVTAANGFELLAGESLSLDVAQINSLYINGATVGEGVTYVALAAI